MTPLRTARARLALFLATALLGITAAGCIGAIAYREQPASGYAYGSAAPLRVAVIDETGGGDWSPWVDEAMARFGAAVPHLRFQRAAEDANIIITVRRYTDAAPPALHGGYSFQTGVGGFAAVYDANGTACFFPPSTLPLTCTGEIAAVDVYLNDAIPPGSDIDARRLRLLLHEFGHGLGLTRHSPDLEPEMIDARYGWR